MKACNMRIVSTQRFRKCLHDGMHGIKLIFLGVAIAVFAGMGAAILTMLLHAIQCVMFGSSESALHPSPVGLSIVHYIAVPSIVMLVAAVIWKWLWGKSSHRIVDIAHAVRGESMSWHTTVMHVCLQMLVVGSGISLGREVAPRELASLIAQRLTRTFVCSKNEQRVLVASAAGAGLAGVYHAPIAGAIMAVGLAATARLVDQSKLERRWAGVYEMCKQCVIFAVALIISLVASKVAQCILGYEVYYRLPNLANLHLWHGTMLLVAIVVGVACGLVGVVFRKLILWSRSHSERTWRMMVLMPIVGLFTGLVAWWHPQIMGNGRALAQYAYDAATRYAFMPYTIDSLMPIAYVLLGKIVLTTLALRSGASGGVLQPSMASGAAIGLITTWALMHMPGIGAMIVQQEHALVLGAVIGASSLLTASRRSLWMALFLVAELVQVPLVMLVPMVIACAIARNMHRLYPRVVMCTR